MDENFLSLPPIPNPEEKGLITMSSNGIWVMKISEKGIRFNPDLEKDTLARAVIWVLEENFNVLIIEK